MSRRKIECGGTRKSGQDKRSEHLIERQKKGRQSAEGIQKDGRMGGWVAGRGREDG